MTIHKLPMWNTYAFYVHNLIHPQTSLEPGPAGQGKVPDTLLGIHGRRLVAALRLNSTLLEVP